MWKEYNLINSFTCEASFCGPTRGKHKGCHFNTQTLEEVGRAFCKTLVDIANNHEKVSKVFNDL